MLNLSKKQVGALLKFMPNDGMRENLEALHLEKYDDGWVLVATNGYIMTILKTNIDDNDGFKDGQFIRRSAIERWHKLANGKADRFNESTLKDVIQDDYAHNNGWFEGSYPNWANVVPRVGETTPTDKIKFNTDYLKIVTELAGEMLTYELHGTLGAISSVDKTGNEYIIMPMKG